MILFQDPAEIPADFGESIVAIGKVARYLVLAWAVLRV